jgi:hypothetical protein
MLFNVEADLGDRISGYLVADNFSEIASFSVSDGGVELLTSPCQETRPAIAAAGRHATGQCGFFIDQTLIPDLKSRATLEIHETKTGILIYRRRPPAEVLQRRIFRLETRLVPLWRLDDIFDSKFQFFYKSIERYGRETTIQLFLLLSSSSLYLSARFGVKPYEGYIDDSFQCCTLLRDPYLELAERLMALKHVRKLAVQLLGEREMMALAPAIDFSLSLTDDPKSLDRLFAGMSKPVIASLGNPLTRQLAAQGANDIPTRGAVGRALGTLSNFTIVGIHEKEELFREQFAELLGVQTEVIPSSRDLPGCEEFSDRLRSIPEVEILIGQDLEIYDHVRAAILSSLPA